MQGLVEALRGNMIKTYAAFIQNTVYPLLEEFREVLDLAETHRLPLRSLLRYFVRVHFATEFMRLGFYLLITTMICGSMVYVVCHGSP